LLHAAGYFDPIFLLMGVLIGIAIFAAKHPTVYNDKTRYRDYGTCG